MTKDVIDYTYNWATAVNELALSMRNLESGMLQSLSGSKEWTVVSRLVSGSAFWRIQNKFRAITDMAVVYDKTMKKAAERTTEVVDAYSSFYKISKETPTFGQERGDHKAIMSGMAGVHGTDPSKFSDEFKNTAIGKIFSSDAFQSAKSVDGEESAIQLASEQVEAGQGMLKAYKKRIQDMKEYGKATMWRKFMIQGSRLFVLLRTMIMAALTFFLPAILKGIAIALLVLPPIVLAASILIRFTVEALGYLGGLYDEVFSLLGGGKGFWSTVGGLFSDLFKDYLTILSAAISGNFGEFIDAVAMFFWNFLVNFGKVGVKLAQSVLAIFGAAIYAMIVPIVALGRWLKDKLSFGKVTGGRKFWNKLGAGGMAATGGVRGGRTLVGENGPELVDLPFGSRVHSNNKSRAMSGNTIHVHVNGRVGASDAEIRDIAQKVAREINLQMNRTTSSRGAF